MKHKTVFFAVIVCIAVCACGSAFCQGGIPADAPKEAQEWAQDLTSEDAGTRADAAYALGMSAMENGEAALPWASPLLRRLLEDPDAQVRKFAHWALNYTGGPSIEEIKEEEKKEARRDAFAALRDSGEYASFIGELQDEDPGKRRAAVHVLAGLKNPIAAKFLIIALEDESESVQRAAIKGLKTRFRFEEAAALADAVSPLLQLLTVKYRVRVKKEAIELLGNYVDNMDVVLALTAALQDKDRKVREEARWALRRIGEAALKVLTEQMKSKDPEVRRAAAEALGEMQDSRASEVLHPALLDTDPQVCLIAKRSLANLDNIIKQLGDRRHERAGPSSLDELIKDLESPHKNVRLKAVHALEELKDPRSVEPLIKALEDKDPNVRLWAGHALVRIKDPRTAQVFINRLEGPGRNTAIVDLGRLGHPLGVEPLIKILKEEDALARGFAIVSLGQIGDPRAVQPLQELRRQALKDGEKPQWIDRSLRQIRSQSSKQ